MKTTMKILLFAFLAFNNTNLFAQWVQTGLDSGFVKSLGVSGMNLFAGCSINGVFLSTDNGTSWASVNSGLTNTDVRSFAVIGENLFAGTNGAGVFLSTNDGTDWTSVSSGMTNAYINALAVSGTSLFAGTSNGMFLSSNNGASWTPINAGLPTATILSLALLGTEVFAGTIAYGVFRSTNNGASWIPAGNPGYIVLALAVMGTNIFAGTQGSGLRITTNNGANWIRVGFGLDYPALMVVGTNLFVASGSGVGLTTNGGVSWNSVNLPRLVDAFAVVGTTLFAGTEDVGVWGRPLSEMITSVENPTTDLPIHFSLEQNYPNPFNPATSISFSLPSQSFVSLKLFDALGREVSILRSEELSAGMYSQQWNPDGLSAGVYFCRLQAGSFIETKKLLLLK